MPESLTPSTTDEPPAWTARKLMRSARQATLATQSGGQPFVGLVTPATTADASLLMLLSDLSEHTRHLRADPRCAILLAGSPTETNPQTAPRVTLQGEAVIDPDAALRARYLAVHPYAALYSGFGDFNIWRLTPRLASFVGGFARAARLGAADLAPEPASVTALADAAAAIIGHCNAEHSETMALLAGVPHSRMVGVDCDGCDLTAAETVCRIAWRQPVRSADDVRRELILAARAARATPDATHGP